MFTQDLLDFMMDLRLNNNKEWMHAHREEYIEKVRTPYYALIEVLATTMLDIDPQMEVRPNKALSRIFRDTRFSNNKLPYRDHHWVAFRHAGEPREKSIFFYFEIRLDEVSWGMGIWGENKPVLDVLRQHMLTASEDFIKFIPILKKNGFALNGASYKKLKVPPELHPKLKSWYTKRQLYVSKHCPRPEIIFTPALADQLKHDFLILKPLYQLLRTAYEIGSQE